MLGRFASRADFSFAVASTSAPVFTVRRTTDSRVLARALVAPTTDVRVERATDVVVLDVCTVARTRARRERERDDDQDDDDDWRELDGDVVTLENERLFSKSLFEGDTDAELAARAERESALARRRFSPAQWFRLAQRVRDARVRFVRVRVQNVDRKRGAGVGSIVVSLEPPTNNAVALVYIYGVSYVASVLRHDDDVDDDVAEL